MDKHSSRTCKLAYNMSIYFILLLETVQTIQLYFPILQANNLTNLCHSSRAVPET